MAQQKPPVEAKVNLDGRHGLAARSPNHPEAARGIPVPIQRFGQVIASGVAVPKHQPADLRYGLPPRWPRQQTST